LPAQPFNVTSIHIFITSNFDMRFFVVSLWSPSSTGTENASQNPHTARNKTGSAVFSSHSKPLSLSLPLPIVLQQSRASVS
jgi:hypothetical protein